MRECSLFTMRLQQTPRAGSDFLSFDLEHGAGSELIRIPIGYTNWTFLRMELKLAIFLDRHRIRFLSLDTKVANDVGVKEWPLSMATGLPMARKFYAKFYAKGRAGDSQRQRGWRRRDGAAREREHWFRRMIQSPDGRNGLLVEDLPGENNAWMVDNF